MDYSFSQEEEMFRQMVKDFTQKEVAPGYTERRKLQKLPFEQRKQKDKKKFNSYKIIKLP